MSYRIRFAIYSPCLNMLILIQPVSLYFHWEIIHDFLEINLAKRVIFHNLIDNLAQDLWISQKLLKDLLIILSKFQGHRTWKLLIFRGPSVLSVYLLIYFSPSLLIHPIFIFIWVRIKGWWNSNTYTQWNRKQEALDKRVGINGNK